MEGNRRVKERLSGHMRNLGREGYPFDTVQSQLACYNRPLRLAAALIARERNLRHISPRIRIAPPSDLSRHTAANWPDRMPLGRGEWQSSRSQTTLGYHLEGGLSR